MDRLTLGYLTLSTDPLTTINAAAAAGFTSVGIRITGRRLAEPGPQVIGNPAAIREIRTRLDDCGLRLSNVSAYHFHPDVTADDLARVAETAQALGTDIVLANDYIPDTQHFLDLFCPYADLARQAGFRLAIEFMKYSELKSLTAAADLARQIARPHVGLLVDPLHLDRAGVTLAELAAIPRDLISYVQLCDARKRWDDPDADTLAQEARTARLEPGEGELDLHGFLDALPRDVEIEYEVPHLAEGSRAQDRAISAYAAFRSFLDGHAAARGFRYDWGLA